MNGTTEQPGNTKAPKKNLMWILLLIVGVLVVIVELSVARRAFHVRGFDVMLPYLTASGLIVKQGIAEFQTGNPEAIPLATTLNIFFSLLAIYVVVPTVIIFYLLHARHLKEKGVVNIKPGVMNALFTLGFLISTLVMAFAVLDTALGAYISPSSFAIMKKDNDINYSRDMLSRDLLIAYTDFMQYYYQTERFGGRNKNIVIAGAPAVRSPEDLGVKTKKGFGSLYLDRRSSDSVIVIDAVGTAKGGSVHFRNADGDSGKIQCSIMIRPNIHKYEMLYAN